MGQKSGPYSSIVTTCPGPARKHKIYSGELGPYTVGIYILYPFNEHPYHKSNLMPSQWGFKVGIGP